MSNTLGGRLERTALVFMYEHIETVPRQCSKQNRGAVALQTGGMTDPGSHQKVEEQEEFSVKALRL